MEEMDRFTEQYAEAALWASTDDDGESLDGSYSVSDLAPETVATMIQDCDGFRELVREAGLESFVIDRPGRVATDFWLTRNRHGAGFWDGDYPEPAGAELTKWAHSYGSADLYVGDDGRIYQS